MELNPKEGAGRALTGWAWVAVLVAALSIAPLASCGGADKLPEDTALDEYRRGLDLHERGKLARADEAFESAILLDPTLAGPYAGRGYVYFAQRQYGLAIEYLNRAIDADPEMALAYHYRGRVRLATNESFEAFLNFTRAIQLDPELLQAYYHRGLINRDNDDLPAAIEDFSTVIDLEPSSPRFHLERAQLYLLNGDTGRAAVDLEQVLALTLDETWALPARQLLAAISQARP